MSLSDADLALIRDEVGDTPGDDELNDLYDDLHTASWIPTALRILRRRRAALAAGGVASVSIPGVVSVSLSASLASIDRQIDRLQRALDALDEPCGVGSSSRVHRQTYRSG